MRPGSGTITEEGKLMFNAIISRTADGRILPATTMFTCLLAVGCLVLSAGAQAAGDNAATRDLTVEQTSIFSIQAPAPADPAPGRLKVVAWVDHADNTYAIGEKVRLFVRSSKDAYLMVLNIGPTGNTTLLFPNAFQKDARIGANRTVEIPAPGSGAGIRVSGPAVGRELIKVMASSEPLPVFEAAGMTSASPFAVIGAGARSVARDLQVTMDAGTSREWDDYNKVITTVASRPFAAASLETAPATAVWPAAASGFRIATGKTQYRLGEPVTIFASTAAPCYLTLVNIGSSGKTRVLLPNAAHPRNLLPAGQTVMFPGAASALRLTPMGPLGVETVTAICSTDNRPVITGDLSYGRGGFAALEAEREALTRDLAVVAAAPARQAAHATVGFLVTQ